MNSLFDLCLLSIKDIQIHFEETVHVEFGTPKDSKLIKHTWLHVNRKGGPDKKIKNNPVLNCNKYGVVRFYIPEVLDLCFCFSNYKMVPELEKITKLIASNSDKKYEPLECQSVKKIQQPRANKSKSISTQNKKSAVMLKQQLSAPNSKLDRKELVQKNRTDIKLNKTIQIDLLSEEAVSVQKKSPVVELTEKVQIDALNTESISEAAKKIVGISDVDFSDDNTELGKRVHAELAEYYKDGSRMSYDDLKENVSRQIARHLSRKAGMQTEFSVSLDGVKGRCDLVIIRKNICQYLADFKTGKNINGKYLEYCEEQLRLYLRALKNNGYNVESTIVEIVCPDGIIPVNKVKDSAISSTIVEIECPDGIIPINIVKDSAISSTSAQGMGKWNQNEPFPWDEYFKNIEKQRQTSKK